MADEVQVTEPIETPNAPVVAPAATEARMSDEDLSKFIETLNRAGVTSSTQLEGHLSNAREFGKVANILGEVKRENETLRQELERIRIASEKRVVADDPYYQAEPTVNIKDIVKNALKEQQMEQFKMQQEAQRRAAEVKKSIDGDEDFPIVKEIWEEKFKDPNFLFQIQTGELDPQKEYEKTVRSFYKNLNKKSAEVIKSLVGGKNSPSAPRMETDARLPGSDFGSETNETKKRVNALREKANSGKSIGRDESLEALAAILKGAI